MGVPVAVRRLSAPRGDGHHRLEVVASARFEFRVARGPRIEVAARDRTSAPALFAVPRAGGCQRSGAARASPEAHRRPVYGFAPHTALPIWGRGGNPPLAPVNALTLGKERVAGHYTPGFRRLPHDG